MATNGVQNGFPHKNIDKTPQLKPELNITETGTKTKEQSNYKLGKVFTRKPTNVDGDIIETLVELNGIRFGNHDFRWYSTDGNVHQEYEKHKGKKFFIKFTLKNLPDQSGQLIDFFGAISLPFGLGMVEEKIDYDGISDAEQFDLQELIDFGLVLKSDGLKTMKCIRAAEIAAAFCPGYKVSQLKLMRSVSNAITLLDDFLDDKGNLNFNELQIFLKLASHILDGIGVNPESLLELPEFLAKFLRRLEHIYFTIICEWKDYSKPVISAIKAYMNVNSLQSTVEWKKMLAGGDSKLLTDTEKELRWVAYGGVLGLEMCWFDQRIHVPQNIRDCQFFQHFIRLIGKQTAMINDLLSYRKDVKDNETSSVVCIMCTTEKVPLQEALQTVLDKANELTDDIVTAGNVLIKLHNNNEEVVKMVRSSLNVVNGFFMWYTIVTRYEPELVFDCIINV